MKKTLTINISGIIFHIDEDAYDKLNNYFDTLKKHFQHTQGRDEIIADIEGRIAELLQERITDAKQVITIDDITEIISLMGEPYEFETGDEEDAEAKPEGEGRGPRRLYRDPDRKIVGGVASGLAAYFNIDILWVRLAFAIFTIFWLSGALVYVVLWIALPEARTTAEKLQMKGEKVNISNIEKSIKEEVSHLKDKINELTNQAKKKVETGTRRGENVFEQIAGLFVSIFGFILRLIVIVIGIVLLLTGIGLTVALLFALFGWGGPMILENNEAILIPMTGFFTLLPVSSGGLAILKGGLVLFIGIPLLMLMYNAFRMIFNLERVRYVGITAFNLWVIGLIITLYFSYKVVREYRHQDTFTKALEIDQPAGDTLYLTLNEEYLDELLYGSYDYIHTDKLHLVITEEGEFFEQVEIEFDKAAGSDFALTQFSHARGRTTKLAREQAEAAEWHFSQEGNLLVLDPYFEIEENGNWRARHVRLRLDIPAGKYVNIDPNMADIIAWGEYSSYRLAGSTWLMTDAGLSDGH